MKSLNPRKVMQGVNLLYLFAMAATILMPSMGYAANEEIFEKSCNMLLTIKKWMFTAVYILGAIGLVLIAVSAFVGRFKFAHLISLGGGLFVVAMADLLIDFLTEGTGTVACSTTTSP